MSERLLTPDEALERVLEHAQSLESEPVPLREALGRTLAVDVTSIDDIPGFDNSAMDGFAVRSQDTANATDKSPVALRIVGESRAGSPASASLSAGEAI